MAIDKDQYKRITIFFEILILIAIHTVIYAIMWEKLYMDTIQLPFFRRGNWAMIALYPIIVLIINKILGGFRVATARKMDLVFSQVFSALFTNVVIYFMLVVLIREYPSVIPLLTFFILQMIYIVIWVILVKGINNVIYPPHDMLMIHGGFSPKETVISINKSSDRYNITELVDVNEGMKKVSERIAAHDSVIISDIPSSQRNDVLKYCYAHNVRVYMLPKITDIVIRSAEDIHVFDSPFFLSKNYGLSFDQKLIKRIEDIVISGLMIVLLSWLFAIVAIAIKICDGGPIFFRQTRLTRDGKEFMMIKFRSMRVNAEEDGARLAAENDSRVTPVGKFIRACHVD
ncbi:MAG: sugar transferase, partial [Parasporobacterium sp.]|nr:sugar transferase [Parasporobacterium sp.]